MVYPLDLGSRIKANGPLSTSGLSSGKQIQPQQAHASEVGNQGGICSIVLTCQSSGGFVKKTRVYLDSTIADIAKQLFWLSINSMSFLNLANNAPCRILVSIFYI